MVGFVWLLAIVAFRMGRMQQHKSHQPAAHDYERLPLRKAVKAAAFRGMPTEHQDSGSEEELIQTALELTERGRTSDQEELAGRRVGEHSSGLRLEA